MQPAASKVIDVIPLATYTQHVKPLRKLFKADRPTTWQRVVAYFSPTNSGPAFVKHAVAACRRSQELRQLVNQTSKWELKKCLRERQVVVADGDGLLPSRRQPTPGDGQPPSGSPDYDTKHEPGPASVPTSGGAMASSTVPRPVPGELVVVGPLQPQEKEVALSTTGALDTAWAAMKTLAAIPVPTDFQRGVAAVFRNVCVRPTPS